MESQAQSHGQSGEILEQLISEQAMRRAKESGWIVVARDCIVIGIATDEALRTGEPHAWIVYMSAHPSYNPSLQHPIRLECRVEWVGNCLCVITIREHTERKPSVI